LAAELAVLPAGAEAPQSPAVARTAYAQGTATEPAPREATPASADEAPRPVAEPSSMVLLLAGLAGIGFLIARRSNGD
jgi:hypothetical protein